LAGCAPEKRQLAGITQNVEAPLALRRYVSTGLPLSFLVFSVVIYVLYRLEIVCYDSSNEI
jgi:hypothetical protein